MTVEVDTFHRNQLVFTVLQLFKELIKVNKLHFQTVRCKSNLEIP